MNPQRSPAAFHRRCRTVAAPSDVLWVGEASDLLDGPAGRLNASEAGVTRVRTALEGSRGFTLGGRLSLTPSVEVGLRRDGGDAERGAGMDVGGGLAFTDAATGLSLDVRVRTLVVHQAEGFAERGMSLLFGWDPTPSSPLGLTAKLAPSWGGQAQGGPRHSGATRWPTAWARTRCTTPAGRTRRRAARRRAG